MQTALWIPGSSQLGGAGKERVPPGHRSDGWVLASDGVRAWGYLRNPEQPLLCPWDPLLFLPWARPAALTSSEGYQICHLGRSKIPWGELKSANLEAPHQIGQVRIWGESPRIGIVRHLPQASDKLLKVALVSALPRSHLWTQQGDTHIPWSHVPCTYRWHGGTSHVPP